MSRYRAFFYHFLISLSIFFVLAYLVLYQWYPDFFYSIDGGWEGMRIIIGVDLILGPLLTLIVFRAGKPGLKFDLTAIGTLQAVCLAAGLYIVYSERPLFFIYYEKHFYSSSADTYTNYGVPTPDPHEFTDTIPAKVVSLLPENPIEEADFRKILFQDGIPAWVYKPTYRKLDEHMETVVTEGMNEEELRDRDSKGNLDAWLKENGGTFVDYAFIPIHSRYRDAFLGIRKSDQEIIAIVEIPPPL
ncbi:MAG: hypothetical protein CMQ20_01445 [Gammaproteobacteria bacterium]|jgi:hypothetical protein|nr:hypothetical protein [Gammaproteobacteria bacterium]|tara:strand:- start:1251 stop:1985 length:735 start_codon:yes stop_codon:yes gene_type:complete